MNTPIIPQEVRERIFALYWGQNIRLYKPTYGSPKLSEVKGQSSGKLLVTPLIAITDEHAIECSLMAWPIDAKGVIIQSITRYSKCMIIRFKFKHEDSRLNLEDGFHYTETGLGFTETGLLISQIDFLRAKGYALPAFGYSVDELISVGVFKLKEVEDGL